MGSLVRSLLFLLAAACGATADWILHTPGGGPIDSSCPCVPSASCPRRFGESAQDFQVFGHLPTCADYRLVRCCGVSFSVVTSASRVPNQPGHSIRPVSPGVETRGFNNAPLRSWEYQTPWNTNRQSVQSWRPESQQPPYPPAIAIHPYETDFKLIQSGAVLADVTSSTSSNNENAAAGSIDFESKRLHSLEEKLFFRPVISSSEDLDDRTIDGGNLRQFTLGEGNSESGTISSVDKESDRLHNLKEQLFLLPGIEPSEDIGNKVVDGGGSEQFVLSEGSVTVQPQATSDTSTTPVATTESGFVSVEKTTPIENVTTTGVPFTVEADIHQLQSVHTSSGEDPIEATTAPVDETTEVESHRGILPETVNEQSLQMTNGSLDVKDPGSIDTANVASFDNETETGLRDINKSLTEISSILSTEIKDLDRGNNVPSKQSSEKVFGNEGDEAQERENEQLFLTTNTTATDASRVQTGNIQNDVLKTAAEPSAEDSGKTNLLPTGTEETLSSNNSACQDQISNCSSNPIGDTSDINTSLDAETAVLNNTSEDTEVLQEDDHALSDDTVFEVDNDYDGSEIVEYSDYADGPEPRMIHSEDSGYVETEIDTSKSTTDGYLTSITETTDPSLPGTTVEAKVTRELSCQELLSAMKRQKFSEGLLTLNDESEIVSTTSLPEEESSTKQAVMYVYPENSRRGRRGGTSTVESPAVTIVYPMNSPCGTASGELADWFTNAGYEVNNRLEDLAAGETATEQLESTTDSWTDSLLGDELLAVTGETTTAEWPGDNSFVMPRQDLPRNRLKDDSVDKSVHHDRTKLFDQKGSLLSDDIGWNQVPAKKVQHLVPETNSTVMSLSSVSEFQQMAHNPNNVLQDSRQLLAQNNKMHAQSAEETIRPPSSSSPTLRRPPTLQQLFTRRGRPVPNAERLHVETDAVNGSVAETGENSLSRVQEKTSDRSVMPENLLAKLEEGVKEKEIPYITLHPSLRNRLVDLQRTDSHTVRHSSTAHEEARSNGGPSDMINAARNGTGHTTRLTDTPTGVIDTELSVSAEQETRKHRNRMVLRERPIRLENSSHGSRRRLSVKQSDGPEGISNQSRYTDDPMKVVIRKLRTKQMAGRLSLTANSSDNPHDAELSETRVEVPMSEAEDATNKMNMQVVPISNSEAASDNNQMLHSRQEKVGTSQLSDKLQKVTIRKLPSTMLTYSSKNHTSPVAKSSTDKTETRDSGSNTSRDSIVKTTEVLTHTTSSEAAEAETHVEKIPTQQGRLPMTNAKKEKRRRTIFKAVEAGYGKQHKTLNAAESMANKTSDINQKVKEKTQALNGTVSNVGVSNGIDTKTILGESATSTKFRIRSRKPPQQGSRGITTRNRLQLSNNSNSGMKMNVTEQLGDKLLATNPQLDIHTETAPSNDEHTAKGIRLLEKEIFQEDSSQMSSIRDQRDVFKPPKHMEGGFVPMTNIDRRVRVTLESEGPAKIKFPLPTKIAVGALRKPQKTEKQQSQIIQTPSVSNPRRPDVPLSKPQISSSLQRPSLPLFASNHITHTPQTPSTSQRPKLPISTSNQIPHARQNPSAPQRSALLLSVSNRVPQSLQKPSTPQRPMLPLSTSNKSPQILQKPSTLQRPTLPPSVSNQISQTSQKLSTLHRTTSLLSATNQSPQTLRVTRHPEVNTRVVQSAAVQQPGTVTNQFSHQTHHHFGDTGVGVSGNSLHGVRGHPGSSQSSLTNILGSLQHNPAFPQNPYNVDIIQQQVIPPNTIHEPGFVHSETGQTLHFNILPVHRHNPVFPKGVQNTRINQFSHSFDEIPLNSHNRPTQPTNVHPSNDQISHITTQAFLQPSIGFPPNVHHADTAQQQLSVANFLTNSHPQAVHLLNAHSTVSQPDDLNVQNRFQQPQQSHRVSHSEPQSIVNNGEPTLEELAALLPEVFYQQVPRSLSPSTSGDKEGNLQHQAAPTKHEIQGGGTDEHQMQDASNSSQVSLRTSKQNLKAQAATDDLRQQFRAMKFIQGLLKRHQKELAQSTPLPLLTTSSPVSNETKPLAGRLAGRPSEQSHDVVDTEPQLLPDVSPSAYQQQLLLYHKQQLAYLQHLHQLLSSTNTVGETS
ncbi:mucin-17-like [Schistocerca gregaria]|uniref:mucin-17-like n=1 Tax=Schistocerca gregaria TaxID=7010 RepID=UPI00211E919E|nr:mucin-17-like [Schistocerca gregaria]